jgi:hypothetical protein
MEARLTRQLGFFALPHTCLPRLNLYDIPLGLRLNERVFQTRIISLGGRSWNLITLKYRYSTSSTEVCMLAERGVERGEGATSISRRVAWYLICQQVIVGCCSIGSSEHYSSRIHPHGVLMYLS